jgi:hypothetical protein
MDWLGNGYRDGQSGIHEKHPNLGAGECCLPPHRVIGVSEESWEAAARGTATVRSHASPDVRQNVTIENGQVTRYRAIRSTAGGDPARIHTGSPVLSSDRCIPLLGSGVECDEEAPVGEFVNVNVTDGLATIRVDRPPMNALNAQIQRELSEATAEVGADPEVRAAAASNSRCAPISASAARARSSGPFGGTIAHGYLTVSLAPVLLADVLHIEDVIGVDMDPLVVAGCVGEEVHLSAGVGSIYSDRFHETPVSPGGLFPKGRVTPWDGRSQTGLDIESLMEVDRGRTQRFTGSC